MLRNPLLRIRLRHMLVTGRAYFALSFFSMVVFVMLGLGGIVQNSLAVSPVQSMKGFAASVSGSFFASLLGLELPLMQSRQTENAISTAQMGSFLIRFLTDLNPDDPKSLLAAEMPGDPGDDAVLLRPGSGGGAGSAPEDRGPLGQGEDAASPDSGPPSGEPKDGGSSAPPKASEPPSADGSGSQTGTGNGASGADHPKTTQGQKVVFIYHSHNRESWFPELPAGTKDPNSSKINVTLVGSRLAKKLEEKGIGTVHSSQDYASTISNYNWNYSYKYSLQTLRQAMADNAGLKYFFDIHRDSQHRNETTATIGGKDYAQVYFIIGHRNPHWKENEAFANAIHEALEKSYPGLSRGIWGKTAANGNGEYNQSVAPDSVLIEIGGVDNTLEECYRTADVLADVIADLYWKSQGAEKAGQSGQTDKTAS
jgi:stage II sporulation protein P